MPGSGAGPAGRAARRACADRRLPRVTRGARNATIARIFTDISVLAASPNASFVFEPGAIVLLGAITTAYVMRWRAVEASVGRLLCFLSGVVVAAVALMSPVDPLGEDLFLMHMTQHVLLLDLAPVLILLGLTKKILRPATRRLMVVEEKAGLLGHPVFAIVAYVAVMWVWHVPALYDAAVRNTFVHVLEHLSFAVAGGLYWWHLLSPIRSRHRLGGMGPVVYMVATKLFVGMLGVALAFAPKAIYDVYEQPPDYWGLSAHDDQSVGGLIMATEQSIVMGVALVYLFVRALSESEREEERAERYADEAI